jgi:signal transduction histidine kinase
LRAAVSLARLLGEQGRRAEAGDVLAPVYRRFTEGFDRPDLREAKALLEREFDRGLAPIELAPQEITRVFLNLFGNGFCAATRQQRDGAGPDFRPTLWVATRDLGEMVEVRVRDNGTGIAPEIRNRLFQPFVTTKPTGEGTGLGLSISWDVVTQQHGGTIAVASTPGKSTEFSIRLPRAHPATAKAAS